MRNSIRNLNLLQYVYFTPKNKQNFDHPVSLMQSILNSFFPIFCGGPMQWLFESTIVLIYISFRKEQQRVPYTNKNGNFLYVSPCIFLIHPV